jgi:hypothetical protein
MIRRLMTARVNITFRDRCCTWFTRAEPPNEVISANFM